jgi:hypothetical protein
MTVHHDVRGTDCYARTVPFSQRAQGTDGLDQKTWMCSYKIRADICNIIADNFGKNQSQRVFTFKFAVLKQKIFIFIHRISTLNSKFVLLGSIHIPGQWNTRLALHASDSNTSRSSYARQVREIILNQYNFTAQTFQWRRATFATPTTALFYRVGWNTTKGHKRGYNLTDHLGKTLL